MRRDASEGVHRDERFQHRRSLLLLLTQMLQYKEFSAWITIEGTEAKEFSIEVSEDEKKVTCWIASEVGKVCVVSASSSRSALKCGIRELRDSKFIGQILLFRLLPQAE